MKAASPSVVMAVVALLAISATAQTVVRRPGDTAADAQRATIARLVDGKNATAAHLQLLRGGAAAVTLLAAEVERDGPAAAAALFVLAELGCDAAPAVPVLRRVAAAEGTSADRRADVRRAIAAIDGPPMLLVPCYLENLVLDYDLDGNLRHSVAFDSPWVVWPAAADGVAALCYGQGRVEHRGWDSTLVARREVAETTSWCFEVGAGDLIRTAFEGKGRFERVDAKDHERWRVECSAVRVMPLVDGRLLVLDHNEHQLRIYREQVQEVTVAVVDECIGVRPLPDGGFLASIGDKVSQLDAAGQQLREWTVGQRVHDAWLLRDGRLAVATHAGVKMLGADGEVIWERSHRMCGPLFVREPASGGRSGGADPGAAR